MVGAVALTSSLPLRLNWVLPPTVVPVMAAGVVPPMAPGAANVAPPSCAALMEVLQPKPVFVVQISALAEVEHEPTLRSVSLAVPDVALPLTVFVAAWARMALVTRFVQVLVSEPRPWCRPGRSSTAPT
jgi:hypothetical protein